jgi:hypothetical protein
MKVRWLLINCYTLQSNYDNTHCNKWDHMFLFQYSMTRFEHIFQKQMLEQPMSLFNNIILLTLKIRYLLIIYIK